jgi:pyruvate dehydrogenase E1 component alpha subunit
MATTAPPDQASREQLLDWYRTMRTIREFEERVHKEFATGEIPGFVHLYAGEEAIATGVCAHLRPDDYIASTHRGHGHAIAKGCDVYGMMAEIYGKRDGLCRGKGGSMHIADVDKGMLGANGIVGGGPPMNCGVGLSAKVRGTDQVGVSFTGDGGSNQGTFLESLNLASVWHLPSIFVVENNGYAESTSDRFHASGVDAAIDRARAGGGPSLLECKVNRYYGHFEGDQQTYRAPGEVDELRRTRDCLDAFAAGVTAAGEVTAEDLRRVDEEVVALIDDTVAKAKAAPEPDPADLLTDVYVRY